MDVTRRDFLKISGGLAAGSVIFVACGKPERDLLVQSPVQLPEDLVTGVDNWYATLCRQCPSTEGIIVRVFEGRAKKIEGNPDYPLNQGKTSVRCQAGVQALYHPDRITGPKRRVGDRGSGQFQDISWDDGLMELTSRLSDLKARGNADTVLLVTEPLRGHLALLIERFAKAYGAKHMAYEPLEQTATKAAIKQVFGQDLMPDLDIANTNFMLSFGADFLGTWLSPVRYAMGYGEFRQGNRKRGTLVQVEPRFSMTAANADEWVPIKPGTEGVLALSIAYVMISEGLADADAARAMTRGDGAQALAQFSPDRAAPITGVSAEDIRELARNFAKNRPSLAIGGGSAAAHTNGTFNLSAIFALNYLVGSVNKAGGVIFNPSSPLDEIPASGKAASFTEWSDLANRLKSGQPKPVNVLLVRGSNPVHGLPAALQLSDSIAKVPLVVSFASFMDETARMADLILPEHVYLEDWGDDIPEPGPGHQTVGMQQPAVNPLYNTRNFGDVLLGVSQRLGGGMEAALPWKSFKDMLREGAQKLYQLNRGSIKAPSFEAFWTGLLQRGGWWDINAKGPSSVPAPKPLARDVSQATFAGGEGEFPFHLVPFPSISLTDGQGANLPWLQATPDPTSTATWKTWVEISRSDAREMGIQEGDVLTIESPTGSIEALAYPNPATPPKVVGMPIGQGHKGYGRYAEGRGANVLSVLAPLADKDTGALAWAATRVKISKTGKWIRLPKFEGSVEPFQLPDAEIVQVTKPS